MGFISKIMGKGSRKPTVETSAMTPFLRMCADIYAGRPAWAGSDGVRTVNFAKTLCSETARLSTLGVGVSVTGSERADYIDGILKRAVARLRRTVELACAYGTVVLKPNGRGVDVVLPDGFAVTDCDGGEILGAVFYETRRAGEHVYERAESHRFAGGVYVITNECRVDGEAAAISATPWAGIAEKTEIEGLDRPLFAVLRMPEVNNVDIASPLGMPLFSDAIEELRDLDVAYSRFAKEISDSRRTVLLDSDRLLPTPASLRETERGFRAAADSMGLPDYVKIVYGSGTGDVYHEINPTLSTSERLTGINALLFDIGNKCGFSGGYFVPDEKSGAITATQVEAEDRRTIGLIRDIRGAVVSCLDELIFALDMWAELYGVAPEGEVNVSYKFDDITYSVDEDRERWYGYVRDGYVTFEEFLERFEGIARPGKNDADGASE